MIYRREVTILDNIKNYIDRMACENSGFERYKSSKGIVGTMCLLLPKEVIYSLGLDILYLPKISRIKDNKSDWVNFIEKSTFSDMICSHSKYTYVGDLPEGYPKPSFFVFPITCDSFLRVFDYIGDVYKVKYINLPRNSKTAEASDYYYNQIQELIYSLEKCFNVKYDTKKLHDAVKLENENRKLMREISNYRKNHCELITSKYARIVQGLYQDLPRVQCNEVLSEICSLLDRASDGSCYSNVNQEKARIILISTTTRDIEIGNETQIHSFLDIVEECGCNIVYEDACSTQSYVDCIELGGDILRNVCDFYLRKIYCPCFIDNLHHYQFIKKIFFEYHADGVIVKSIKGCKHFEARVKSLREYLEEAGINVLICETNGIVNNGIARITTQIESFSELLKDKVGKNNVHRN